MNIRGYYLHSLNKNVSPSDLAAYGVQKKINAQIKTLNNYFDCKEIVCYQIDSFKLINRIKSRLPFTAISEKWVYDEKYNDIDFIYFRKSIIDYSIVSFFKKIKKNNPSCKIILEIPTYPYDKEEFNSFKDLPFKFKDRINRKRLYKYVDRISTVASKEEIIFKIPVINFMNGIDFSLIKMKTKNINSNSISILCLAFFSRWHGYDRLINGLANYYQKEGSRKIILHFVGNGFVVPQYKQLVSDKNIGKNVIFYGNKSGRELDKIVDECDIACDSLGANRLGLSVLSTLKSREYSGRGLPIIASAKIDFLDDNYPFLLKVPADESPIDFFEIEKFYDSIFKEHTHIEIAKLIRDNAINLVDYSKTLAPLIKYIKSEV